MGRDVFYRLGEKRNKILDISSSKIIDKEMTNIILNYENLIIDKEKKENLIDKIEYKYYQLLIYLLKIKNNPQIIKIRISKFLYKIKSLNLKNVTR